MIVRRCSKCGRTFDAPNCSAQMVCQACLAEISDCDSITDAACYLKDKRPNCDEPCPTAKIRISKEQRQKKNDISPEFFQDMMFSQNNYDGANPSYPSKYFSSEATSNTISDEAMLQIMSDDFDQHWYPNTPVNIDLSAEYAPCQENQPEDMDKIISGFS